MIGIFGVVVSLKRMPIRRHVFVLFKRTLRGYLRVAFVSFKVDLNIEERLTTGSFSMGFRA